MPVLSFSHVVSFVRSAVAEYGVSLVRSDPIPRRSGMSKHRQNIDVLLHKKIMRDWLDTFGRA